MKIKEYQEKYLEVYDKAMKDGNLDVALAALNKMFRHETEFVVCKICGNKEIMNELSQV